MNERAPDDHELFVLTATDITSLIRALPLQARLTHEDVEQVRGWQTTLSLSRPAGPWRPLWRQAVVLVGMLAAMGRVSVVTRRWALTLRFELIDLMSTPS